MRRLPPSASDADKRGDPGGTPHRSHCRRSPPACQTRARAASTGAGVHVFFLHLLEGFFQKVLGHHDLLLPRGCAPRTPHTLSRASSNALIRPAAAGESGGAGRRRCSSRISNIPASSSNVSPSTWRSRNKLASSLSREAMARRSRSFNSTDGWTAIRGVRRLRRALVVHRLRTKLAAAQHVDRRVDGRALEVGCRQGMRLPGPGRARRRSAGRPRRRPDSP